MSVVRAGPRRRRESFLGASPATGRVFIARRLALGITQSDLADLSGVGVSSIRALEAGKTTVSLGISARVADALGLVIAVGPGPALRVVDDAAIVERSTQP